MGSPAVYVSVQSWLTRLYSSEATLRRMRSENAPPENLEKSQAWLRKQWQQALAFGITEAMFSAYSESLYLHDVSMVLEEHYQNSCACHSRHVKQMSKKTTIDEPSLDAQMDEFSRMESLRPCGYFDDISACSPLCPAFRPLK